MPIRATLADCASAASGAAKRPLASVPRNLRRVVLRLMLHLLRCGPASSRNDALTLASETGVVKRRWSLRPGMQHVDRPAQIQPLPKPAGARRPRVDPEALRVVTCAESPDGITEHCSRRRHLRQRAPVRPLESKRPVGPARDLVALLVNGAVMPAAEERQVRERRRAAVRPVTEVIPLAEADAAAGEAAAPVPMVERAP